MTAVSTTHDQRRMPLSFVAISAIAIAAVLLPVPGSDGRILHVPSLCGFQVLTGLPCPFCGLTRSIVCLGHGRLIEALHYHPLGPAFAIFGIVLWIDGLLRWRKGAGLPVPEPRSRRALITGGVLTIVGVAIVRDILVATHRLVL